MELRIPELLYIDELIAAGEDPRPIRRAARAGYFVRVRRGIYCARDDWEASDDRGRSIARSRAVFSQLRAESRALAAGYSAGAIHGLRVLRRWPDVVTLLVPYRGGGTAEPGVVRTSARWDDDHLDEQLAIPVTTVERTIFDIALIDGFEGGVATMDAALRAGLTDSTRLARVLERWSPASGGRRCAAVLGFATADSESFGESFTRGAIHTLGFPPPVLQQGFVDEQGEMFADFFWPEFGVVAEFDGKVKYTRDEYTSGDPAAVVWREKLREDRLRRQVRAVVRITWSDVRDPRQLAALLEGAGVSRRHRFVRKDTRMPVSFVP
jgi:predicted transcriptional regulator of viral defense system